MLGDKATELPYEEKVEKTLNVQEGKGVAESGEVNESTPYDIYYLSFSLDCF